ncbi:zinc metalloproteinase dpy-31-like [Lineus longissimus]|uniref:zinc metalloproteinase dpy-31-like n=1 Tax=Lineus longissimus TaxID=88925 RepID=UPI002B4E0D57
MFIDLSEMEESWHPSSWADKLIRVFIFAILMLIQTEQSLTSISFTSNNSGDAGDGTSPHLSRIRRKALRAETSYWPNAIIPYVIDSSVSNISTTGQDVILSAMKHWSKETCIRFEQYDKAKHGKDFLSIKANNWCEAQLGCLGGEQHVFVNAKCLTRGIMIHELGHTVGFIHEHNRPDRDEHVIIQWEKIKVKPEDYIKKSNMLINTFGVPYDFRSIMQYRAIGDELLAKDPRKQHLMGQRKELSFRDKKLANLMYKCNRDCPKNIKCKPPGFVNFRCECVCPGSNPCSTLPEALVDKKRTTNCSWSYGNGLLVDVPPQEGLGIGVRSFIECKVRCAEETKFQCLSVHYEVIQPNSWIGATRICHLQQKAGQPGKMRFIRKRRMYYMEAPGCIRRERFCGWDIKDGIVLYPDDELSKINYNVTLNECKINCLEESQFLCSSFMYRRTNKLNSVCIHTHRTVRTVVKQDWGQVPGVTYYERAPCPVKHSMMK